MNTNIISALLSFIVVAAVQMLWVDAFSATVNPGSHSALEARGEEAANCYDMTSMTNFRDKDHYKTYLVWNITWAASDENGNHIVGQDVRGEVAGHDEHIGCAPYTYNWLVDDDSSLTGAHGTSACVFTTYASTDACIDRALEYVYPPLHR